jgi:hypothetical protein
MAMELIALTTVLPVSFGVAWLVQRAVLEALLRAMGQRRTS